MKKFTPVAVAFVSSCLVFFLSNPAFAAVIDAGATPEDAALVPLEEPNDGTAAAASVIDATPEAAASVPSRRPRKLASKKNAPTEAPTDAPPTPAPIAPVVPPTDVPMPETCSADEGKECIPSLAVRNSVKLRSCLEDAVGFEEKKVTILEYMGTTPWRPSKEVLKVTFPEMPEYNEALFSAGFGFPRYPAAIFYAENETEVINAVNCARKAGYKISPRGRGHSLQGLGSMDGYLVIDMSLICNPGDPEDPKDPGEFEVRNSIEVKEKYNRSSWIFGEDQKILGSIKSGAGCTNALMLAYTSKHPEFAGEKGGIMLIGSCPAVGIAGYATGGGLGDTTPYVGLGVDDVIAYDIVLYDGEKKTASKTEHPDLYWYLRGGGSGIGVITKLETVIVQSPDPEPETTRKFTYVAIQYSNEEEKVKKFITRFQDFLVPPHMAFDSPEYKEKIKKGSALFGGSGSIGVEDAPFTSTTFMQGHFLGSEEEARKVFDEYQLLDDDIGAKPFFYEGDSYGDIQASLLCNALSTLSGAAQIPQWYTWAAASIPPALDIFTYDVCKDLDIDSDALCYSTPNLPGAELLSVKVPKCTEPTVIEALLNAALKPQSFINRPGFEQMARFYRKIVPDYSFPSLHGGLVLPRLEPDVLLELAKLGMNVNHLAHGAPTLIAPNATGYANREEFWLLDFQDKKHYDSITSILTNKVYGGDPAKVRGFYNYLNPLGNPHWREYYWGDNYKRLSEIKLVYDKTNGFGNPAQVGPAIPSK